MKAEIEEELRAHIRHRADDLERSGLGRAEAERRARYVAATAKALAAVRADFQEPPSPPFLFITGHPPAKPDTQFGSRGTAISRTPLCPHKVAF